MKMQNVYIGALDFDFLLRRRFHCSLKVERFGNGCAFISCSRCYCLYLSLQTHFAVKSKNVVKRKFNTIKQIFWRTHQHICTSSGLHTRTFCADEKQNKITKHTHAHTNNEGRSNEMNSWAILNYKEEEKEREIMNIQSDRSNASRMWILWAHSNKLNCGNRKYGNTHSHWN